MEPDQSPTPSPAPPPAKTKTCECARASFIFGILCPICIVSFLAFIPAIIFGAVSLLRIRRSNGALKGKYIAIAGLALGCIGPFVNLYLITVSTERANRSQCLSNLRGVGFACKAYANDDGNGMLPPDLKMLMPPSENTYITDAKLFTCASSPTTEPIGGNINRDYFYFGTGHKDSEMDARTVLMADRPGNHKGRFINILFGDGHVEGVEVSKGTDLRAIAAEKGWKIPGAK